MMVSVAILASLLMTLDVKTGIAYNTVDNKPILMDLYLPDNPARRPMAVAIMIHGGAWMAGTRTEMTPLAAELANKGIAVANIDYRLAPAHKWPAMLDDCQAAVLYVRSHALEYGLDPTRVGAVGGSAGAHLSMMLGFTERAGLTDGKSARVMAVVNFFGPVDLTQDFAAGLANMVSTNVLGKKYEDSKEEAKAFSPINHIDAHSCPVYSVQGTADPLVPIIQSQRLDEAMKKAGRVHTRIVVEGMAHGVTSKDPEIDKKIKEEVAKSMDWLVAQLSK